MPSRSRCQYVALLQVDGLITGGRSDLMLTDLQATFKFPLDSFQSNAMQALLDGESVVCCAPTGAGKTAIAEAAAVSVLARWALVHQKYLIPEAAAAKSPVQVTHAGSQSRATLGSYTGHNISTQISKPPLPLPHLTA